MATSTTKISVISRLASAFCNPVDGAFSLDRFADGSLIMVGDEVRVDRRLFPSYEGTIAALNIHHHVDNYETYSAVVKRRSSYRRVCMSRISQLRRQEKYRSHWAKIFLVDQFDDDEPRPLSSIDLDFKAAVVFLAHGDQGRAKKLLESVTGRIDSLRQLAKSSQLGPVDSLGYPSMLKLQVYANVLAGNRIDYDQLIWAARLINEQCQQVDPFNWHGSNQDKALSAARASIIGGDLDLARDFLRSKRSFSRHKDQRALLKKLVRKSVAPSSDSGLVRKCTTFVDFVRRPHTSNHAEFSGNVEWLEWPLIVESLLGEGIESPHTWQRVIENALR